MTFEPPQCRIACAHLYDDFSGSAKVFSHAITELRLAGALTCVTVGSAGKSGFIRAAHPAQAVFYRYSERRPLLLFFFVLAQALLFARVLHQCLWKKIDIVYANTVLAPGALLAGWLCRRRVIVHLHEVGLGSKALFKFLLWLTTTVSDQLICVSEYMRTALSLPPQRTAVVYNSLSADEWASARAAADAKADSRDGAFVVLMACSLKWYKGLDSFLLLASRFAAAEAGTRPIQFRLLLNCSPDEWTHFAAAHSVPPNVAVVLRPADIYSHYREASLVLNLSHREGWIETFGMTLLEAMACGVPVVSPVVGGCTELFADGEGGWRIDSRNLDAIAVLVNELAADRSRWLKASNAAVASAAGFNRERFSSSLRAAVFPAKDAQCGT